MGYESTIHCTRNLSRILYSKRLSAKLDGIVSRNKYDARKHGKTSQIHEPGLPSIYAELFVFVEVEYSYAYVSHVHTTATIYVTVGIPVRRS